MFRFEELSRNKHLNTIISNFQVFLPHLNNIKGDENMNDKDELTNILTKYELIF